MSSSSHTDCFTIVNGPEDGTEFPVVRTPLFIGRDPSCAIHVRADSLVRENHVQVTAVSDGYRIRRWDTAAAYVNGKRVGTFRSRIVRNGGLVQAGNTLLWLECAPDGLASRSHGLVTHNLTQNDLVYAVRQILKWVFRGGGLIVEGIGGIFGVFRWAAGRLLRSWFLIGGAIGVMLIVWPQFRYAFLNITYTLYYRAYNIIYSLIH